MVIFRECDRNVELFPDSVAHNLVFKAGNKLAGAQSELIVLRLAAVELLAVQIAVKIDGDNISVSGGPILHVNHAGIALAHPLDLLIDVSLGYHHRLFKHFNALVAFNRSFRLGNHIQLAQKALFFANFINFKLADADYLQTGLFHGLHHHGAVQVVNGSFIKNFFPIILLNKCAGSMALAETGDIHLLALTLVNSIDRFVKLFGADFQLQFVTIGFYFVGRFNIHDF